MLRDIVEEFLAFSGDNRFDCSDVFFSQSYSELSNAFLSHDNKASLKHLHKFLKKWYKDLAGVPWHDTHKSDGGYYGYWSFEAACSVILLEIDDDKELYDYLYYPKDLIAFYHSFNPTEGEKSLLNKYNRIAIKAGEKASQSGYCFTVASDNSRQYFKAGEILLEIKTQDWTEKTYSIYKDPLWNTVKQSQGFDDVWFYHCDHLGTPQKMSDQTGAIVWKAQYKAWGGECKVEQAKSDFFENSEIISNNIRFQGQYFDGETGLHYNRYRYYSPYVGRFISKDPIGLLGGFNVYSYAPNPVVWIDPFGLTCKSWLAKALDAGHTIPSDMTRPHGHHIVFKGKFEKTAYAPYVNKSKSILKKYGIDPVNDPANLRIANNGQGVHTVENAKKVSVELTKADREISSAVKCGQITVAQSKVLMRAELQIIGQKVFGGYR